MSSMASPRPRAEVPPALVERLGAVLLPLPWVTEEDAWVGVRWRVGQATIAHVFGGEDGLIRVSFRGDSDDVIAFEHLGPPYYRAGWGDNVIGMVIEESTDFDEVAELLVISYCLQAPRHLAEQVLASRASGT